MALSWLRCMPYDAQMQWLVLSIIFVVGFSLQKPSYAQSGCARDDMGRVYCAAPGGTAVRALTGIVCAPGNCISDNLGYVKCSSEIGGGVAKDALGRVVCVGQCITPSKEFCKPPTSSVENK